MVAVRVHWIMRLALASALVPTLLLLAPPTAAACCPANTTCLGTITIGSGRGYGDPLPTFYIDDRNSATGGGTWIYQETDGYDGLQWGPICSQIVPNDCDYCTRSGIPENDSLLV